MKQNRMLIGLGVAVLVALFSSTYVYKQFKQVTSVKPVATGHLEAVELDGKIAHAAATAAHEMMVIVLDVGIDTGRLCCRPRDDGGDLDDRRRCSGSGVAHPAGPVAEHPGHLSEYRHRAGARRGRRHRTAGRAFRCARRPRGPGPPSMKAL